MIVVLIAVVTAPCSERITQEERRGLGTLCLTALSVIVIQLLFEKYYRIGQQLHSVDTDTLIELHVYLPLSLFRLSVKTADWTYFDNTESEDPK